MTALAYHYGDNVTSGTLSESVNADPSFVRRTIARLAKAGLVSTTRGKNGTCSLSRMPAEISLLDIYQASDAPSTFAIHTYLVEPSCPISSNIKDGLAKVLNEAQQSFEQKLEEQSLADMVGVIRQRARLSSRSDIQFEI